MASVPEQNVRLFWNLFKKGFEHTRGNDKSTRHLATSRIDKQFAKLFHGAICEEHGVSIGDLLQLLHDGLVDTLVIVSQT